MCTLEKRGNIFFLTLTGDDDEHVLNPNLIGAIRSSLSHVRQQATAGCVLVTTAAQGKFFCNGFDFNWAKEAGESSAKIKRLRYMVEVFKPLIADLISLPMPTIAAVTGHAAAAGMILAMSHDYVMMGSYRGVMYMSELDIAITYPDFFTAVIRSKARSPMVMRDIMLKGMKVRAEEGVKMGMVDSAHDSREKVVEAAMRLGEELGKRSWNGDVYAEIRKAMHQDLCGILSLTGKSIVASSRL
ncbi:enoyl-CoA delta isomerase 2, peroxisomal-like [Impatiens glandulifera]|uniref:enoyl-CoA delta isomerase 2, peroxisomal-like n=1 Tax=Impatiens glandulifera TaxID=253017 RepID=UPI001FB120C7|nr:enoyl-CoA delta isomerase 2, peroxisomal-like [Impatiens glandulifera]